MAVSVEVVCLATSLKRARLMPSRVSPTFVQLTVNDPILVALAYLGIVNGKGQGNTAAELQCEVSS